MSQTRSMLVLVCVVLALSGASASSRSLLQARKLTSCTSGCSTLLGSAVSFGVLATSTVTSDGPTKVEGNLGVPTGASVNGFPQGNVTGVIYVGGGVEEQAKKDAVTAFAALEAMNHNASSVLSGKDLVGMNLTAGVYFFAAAAQLSGNMTFNAQGNASAIFVIQTGSTFMTSSKSNILLIGGAKACNVFIQVGSSATIADSSVIRGSILARASVTLQKKAIVHGIVVAVNAAVVLDTNTVNSPATCNWSGSTHHHPAPAPKSL